MPPNYSQVITRDADRDPLEIPEQMVAEVIQEAPRASTVLSLARRVTMSSRKARQPVLSVLPEAYFVAGDLGLKAPTAQDWRNLDLVAEPIATLVVIPDEYVDDSGVPIWAQVRPRLVEAVGRTIDKAALFGINKPDTWGPALLPATIASGNVVTATRDLAVDVANLGLLIAQDGFPVVGFATEPGFRWRLYSLRSLDGIPIYAPPAGEQPATLLGFSMFEAMNGAWNPTAAHLICGDWSKAITGIRADMQWSFHPDGVISDDEGRVVLNAMQQDAKILRLVMRIGWNVAAPITAVNPNDPWPFGVLRPATTTTAAVPASESEPEPERARPDIPRPRTRR